MGKNQLLFVMFINDLHTVISPNTNVALYADDTKIWRVIESESDCCTLQNDIDSMNNWARRNFMKFHPLKCKVLSVTHKIEDNILPFSRYSYRLGGTILDYVHEEKDLGIIINHKLNWKSHHQLILSKATSMFNLLRRTCHFVKNPAKKRTLYLTLIRSLLQHGSVIWASTTQSSNISFEALQKRCVKWILNEQFTSYSQHEYIMKLKDLDLLPVDYKFALTDLIVFHKIVHHAIPINIPEYLTEKRSTRSQPSHHLNFTVTDEISSLKCCFKSNFFVRNLSLWNSLPISLREGTNFAKFASEAKTFIWDKIMSNYLASPHNFDFEPD